MTDASPASEPKKNRQWIRQAVDFGALAAFMIAYFTTRDMILATWVLVGASALALVVGYAVERRFAPLPLITGLFALVFGLLTVFTHDDLFIKLKLTVQNGLLAVILLGSIPLKKYPFKMLLGSAIRVNDAAWRTLTLRYGCYFLVVALLNEVFRNPPVVTALWHALGRDTPNANDVWTSFRGVLWIAASVFGLSQVPLIMKNMIKDEEPGPVSPDTGL
jgi:intracellular septation protein